MNRPWQIAAAFGVCLAVVLAGMAWISREALRLDRAEAEARQQALREESVRLALWRMESALGPLVAQESARPYFVYAPFYSPELPYAEMLADLSVRQRGYALLPSPILVQASPQVRLHFQFGPDGRLTSPQVPTGALRARAEAGHTTAQAIDAAAATLAQFREAVGLDALETALSGKPEALPAAPPAEAVAQRTLADDAQAPPQVAYQQQRNVQEWQARAQTLAIMNRGVTDQIASNTLAFGGVGGGVMRPVWIGEHLVLARQVTVNAAYLQGVWLDWPALRAWLLEGVRDLLPHADLVPVTGAAGEDAARRLASLPVRLVPGDVPVQAPAGLSPVALSLVVAWVCVGLGAAAVAGLLWGTVALSERRAAFVSAVTHELRTPLTTFRMYSEMLAEGMVPDEAKRRRYLETLSAEARRLTHLVENVLAYARLERGRARGRAGTVSLEGLLARVTDRLADRARQGGMDLVVEVREGAGARTVRADESAVEQVLFNLVDNACKYAASASDRRVHLVAGSCDGQAALRVCDHGPGVASEEERRLFRPFAKSARDAAHSAPGVGLGLALSRRLAREMGGDLALEEGVSDGACFVLRLPGA